MYSLVGHTPFTSDGNSPPVGGGFEDLYLCFDASDNLHLLFHAFCNEPAVVNDFFLVWYGIDL